MKRAIGFCVCLLVMTLVGCALYHKEKTGTLGTQLGPQPGEDQYERAGCPRDVHCLAHPSDTGHYVLYRVGGGEPCPHKAEPPCPDEGTPGWDYSGICVPAKVDLGWSHGRYQGGTGAYRTDGPAPIKRFHEHRERRGESHGGGEGHGSGGHE